MKIALHIIGCTRAVAVCESQQTLIASGVSSFNISLAVQEPNERKNVLESISFIFLSVYLGVDNLLKVRGLWLNLIDPIDFSSTNI